MLSLKSVLLFSEDPKGLSSFYGKVLGKKPDMEFEGYNGYSAGGLWLVIGPHDKVKGASANPERIMLNFETTDVAGEFDRIKGLGARVVAEPYGMGEGESAERIATFADPDGNFFQLMTPMPEGG
jgi:predicted enzyme related to lactoylglutathione lyase